VCRERKRKLRHGEFALLYGARVSNLVISKILMNEISVASEGKVKQPVIGVSPFGTEIPAESNFVCHY